jgi:signal transduction histidine kinase
MERYIVEAELLERCHWLVKVRWVFVAVLTVVLILNGTWIHAQRETPPLWGVVVAIVVYNIGFSIYARRRFQFCLIGATAALRRRISVFAASQMVLDLAALTVLLRYSGGIENPLALFYIFHVMLAGILLEVRARAAMATLAIVLVGIVAVGELAGFIAPHYGFLNGAVMPDDGYAQPAFVFCWLAAFATAMYGSVLISGRVASNLREREQDLIRARQGLLDANARLEGLERRKSQFMITAAHQIKSPLAAIANLVDAVRIGPLEPDKRDEMLARVRNRAASAAALVQEMLQLARLRDLAPERFEWKVLDFRDVVRNLQSAVSDQLRSKNQVLETVIPEKPAWVEGDSNNLFDAVLNLTENAVKYTDPGGTIRLEIRDALNDWELSVSDTGIGIPQSDVTKLFADFFRASNATRRRIEGTGLGLTIVKQIVQMHKGDITVTSVENQGTTFRIRLPKAP